ncbi:hypothetical protein ACIOGT_26880 [Streptomyces microflavus]|uniref:hypothetical protein n=1 Tax=Streptomyces microflavus TaxID=1919 RepID=UPI0037F75B4A
MAVLDGVDLNLAVADLVGVRQTTLATEPSVVRLAQYAEPGPARALRMVPMTAAVLRPLRGKHALRRPT